MIDKKTHPSINGTQWHRLMTARRFRSYVNGMLENEAGFLPPHGPGHMRWACVTM